MKKIYRRSQMKDVIGSHVYGLHMYKYGMPYRNGVGFILPEDLDLLDLAFLAVELHPELHLITELENGWTVNRYQKENADVHFLATGNPDPEIEFSTEHRLEDWTPEEIERGRRELEEFRNRELTPLEVAAVGFAMNAVLKCK